MNAKLFAFAVLPSVAGLVAAQGVTKVVPTFAAYADAGGGSAYPLAYTTIRSQQIWNAGTVANTVALIQKFALRADTRSGTMNAFTLQGAKMSFSHTSVSAGAMSTTFANNRTGTATVVFNANLNVPGAVPPPKGPNPFNVVVPLTSPFVYTTVTGNLMLEVETPTGTPAKSGYIADAHGTGGLTGQFGVSGSPSGGDTLTLVADPGTTLVPGGSVTVTTATVNKTYVGAMFIGSSDKTWLSIPLPLDLTIANAPGNFLYTGIELSVPHNFVQSGGRWVSAVNLPVPNIPQWAGNTVFAQSFLLDGQANQFGAVFSNGMSLGIGTAGPQPINHIGNYDPAAATGNFGMGNTGGGFVVEFTGAIS